MQVWNNVPEQPALSLVHLNMQAVFTSETSEGPEVYNMRSASWKPQLTILLSSSGRKNGRRRKYDSSIARALITLTEVRNSRT